MTRLIAALATLWLLVACTDPAGRGGGNILVLGDSVMAWNGASGRAIGDGLAATLGRQVTDRAVPGAQFDAASGLAGAIGFDIRRQYPGGRWSWIVLNGGANDLGRDCGCGACGAVVDRLIAPDARSGAIPAFLDRLHRESGARIMWMGYYRGNGRGSFQGCRDDLVAMEARIAQLARSRPYLIFADAEDVIDPAEPGIFAADNTHPSPRASALIGRYLGQQILQAERSQSADEDL